MKNSLTPELVMGTIFFVLGIVGGWIMAKSLFAPFCQ